MGSEKDIDHTATTQTSGEEPSILKLANECDELFRRAIDNAEGIPSSNTKNVASRTEGNGLAKIGSATSTRRLVQDLHARYGFWVSYLGVFAPQPASLDRRLRRNKYYREMILLALDMLRDNIVQILPSEEEFAESGDSDYSEESMSDNGAQNSDQYKTALEGIRDSLNQLNEIAVSIRQSSTSTSAARIMAFQDKERNKDHVRKFRKLASLVIEALYPNAAESLRNQLSKSVLDRYSRLQYWNAHDRKLRTDTRPPHQIEGEERQIPATNRAVEDSRPSSIRDRGGQQRVSTYKPASTIRSDTEATTLKTVPQHVKEKKNATPKPSATSARFVQVEFPRPPKLTIDENHARCQFCRKLHPRERYEDNTWWESHVEEDLQPYLCLSEACQASSVFADRKEWAAHMVDKHGERWSEFVHPTSSWKCQRPGHGPDAVVLFANLESLEKHRVACHPEVSSTSLRDDQAYPRCTSFADLTIEQPEIEVQHSRPTNLCPLCYNDPSKDPLNRVKKRANTESNKSEISNETPDDEPPISAAKCDTVKKSGKMVAFDDGIELEKDAGGQNTEADFKGPPIDTKTKLKWNKAMDIHVAMHLRSLAFLTLRLLPENLEAGKDLENCSSNASSVKASDATRSTTWKESFAEQEGQPSEPTLGLPASDSEGAAEAPPDNVPPPDINEEVDDSWHDMYLYGNQGYIRGADGGEGPQKFTSSSMPSGRLPERCKLGLEDPRVFKCFDRGDNFFWDNNRPSRSSRVSITSSTTQRDDIIRQLRNALEKAILSYPFGSYRYFIPRDKLSSLTDIHTVHSVLHALSCCNGFSPADIETLAHEICFGNGTRCHRPCGKLLALLILCGRQEDLIALTDEGMDDNCLPLAMITGRNALRCRNPQHNHRVINDYSPREHRELHQWSYAVKAPYFTKPKKQHVHYVLEHNDVLPILQAEDHTASGASDATHSTGGARKPAERVSTYGGFSHFQCVKFHPSHIQFGPENHLNGDRPFALKKLRSRNIDDFNKELASHLTFQEGDYKHLIQLLVTFEIKGAQGSDSSEFHLVFPWADGTLWDFWNRYQAPEQRLGRSLWMAEQCYELAIALQHVHNERDQNVRKLPDVDKNVHELYGRHGDFRAENTLWFGSMDILVMTNFGLGRLHSKISVSNDMRSTGGMMTYSAPEIEIRDGRITRACDIYSMGCMLLEFITWHLEGWNSVSDEFVTWRQERDHHGFMTDTFFQIVETPGGPQTAITKPQVTSWISRLKQHPKCTQFHLDFLELVEKRMLEPKAHERIKSPELTRKLRVISETCRTDSDYWKLPASPSRLPS